MEQLLLIFKIIYTIEHMIRQICTHFAKAFRKIMMTHSLLKIPLSPICNQQGKFCTSTISAIHFVEQQE